MQTKLNKKQLSVIDDLFASQADEPAIFNKHKVSRHTFNKWLVDENFKAEFIRRIEWLNLQSQALIARYASLAAAKLVGLTESENQETRRKACLDIISLPKQNTIKPATNSTQENSPYQRLNPQTAGKIMEILANENETMQNL